MKCTKHTEEGEVKFEVEIPDAQIAELTFNIFENYPEYSSGNALKCTSYKYGDKTGKGFDFTFEDVEEEKTYKLTFEQAKGAVEKFIRGRLDGTLNFKLGPHDLEALLDAGNYDIDWTDAITQLALLGEIIYG